MTESSIDDCCQRFIQFITVMFSYIVGEIEEEIDDSLTRGISVLHPLITGGSVGGHFVTWTYVEFSE
jgi:hypothetical protein